MLVCFGRALLSQGPPVYAISTVAGAFPLGDGGLAPGALLLFPESVAVDGSRNIYIADSGTNRIRKVDSNDVITTVAGGGPGALGQSRVPAVSLALFSPRGLIFDRAGNLVFIDGQLVRRITADGIIRTLAGSGQFGFAGDGRSAFTAAFRNPSGLAFDLQGNLYIADTGNHRIRRVTPAGVISTYAGTGFAGFSGDTGPAIAAQLNSPTGLLIDASNILFFADTLNHRVRAVDRFGTIVTLAGVGVPGSFGDGAPGRAGALNTPRALVVDEARNILIAERSRIRRLSPSGILGTFAGSTPGFAGDGGTSFSARLNTPTGLAVDRLGDLYIADSFNHRLRRVSAGIIDTVAGSTHYAGDGGPATAARFQFPRGVTLDRAGNLYIVDTWNHAVRLVSPAGIVRTVVGNGSPGSRGDNGPAAAAQLNFPDEAALDAAGALYIADTVNHRIRKVSPVTGNIANAAGSGVAGFGGDGLPALAALLTAPSGVTVDAEGGFYIADQFNHRVRKVTPDGLIATIAGTGEEGFGGDDGPATEARLAFPSRLALDTVRNLYILDLRNRRIRRVAADGVISTFAGTGACCSSGDGGPAAAAAIDARSLALDGAGNLLIGEPGRIRRVDRAGRITTIAGTGTQGFRGDRGLALAAELTVAASFTVDGAGNIWFADEDNNRIRLLTPLAAAELQMVRGDNQSALVGSRLAVPLTVRLLGTFGLPVPGALVRFTVASGAATLGASGATMVTTMETATETDGSASVVVTFGAATGAVVIEAVVGGLRPVRFNLTSLGPAITPGGVEGLAGSASPVRALSPNALIVIRGVNFAPPGVNRQVALTDYVDGRVPTRLAGACVLVGEKPAAMLGVTPTEIRAQAPDPGDTATAGVQVLVNCGAPAEAGSNVEILPVQPAAPEFLYWKAGADGVNPIRAVHALTGAAIGPDNLLPNITTTPALAGDVVILFALGLGATDPAFDTGVLPDRAASVTGAVALSLGELELAPEEILYVGVAVGQLGLYQVAVRIPENAPEGNLPVVLRVGAFASPPGAYLAVRR